MTALPKDKSNPENPVPKKKNRLVQLPPPKYFSTLVTISSRKIWKAFSDDYLPYFFP